MFGLDRPLATVGPSSSKCPIQGAERFLPVSQGRCWRVACRFRGGEANSRMIRFLIAEAGGHPSFPGMAAREPSPCRESKTHAFSQFSTRTCRTRWNSHSLFVTIVAPIATACAAIKVSRGPIGVPARSSAARISP